MKIGIAGPMSLDLLKENFYSIPDFPPGYPFPLISMLINELIDRGHEVVAFTTSIGLRAPKIIIGTNLKVCIAPRESHAARDLFKSEREHLFNLMKNNTVDIIHANWTYEFAWAALDSGFPTLVSVHDHAYTILRYQLDPYRLMRLIMNQIVLMKAGYLSVNSPYLFNLLNLRDREKAKVIPNFFGSELENYQSFQNKKENYIITIANGFGKRKNISATLKAFTEVRSRFPSLEYYLVGDGMQVGGPAYNFAMSNNLQNGVKFLGKLPYSETLEKLSKAKLLLHPSKEESFGMTVLEAMVLETPVIGGIKSGNIPFLLEFGKAGLLCDINSAEPIVNAITILLTDKKYFQSIQKTAKQMVYNKYTKEIVVDKYTDYYQDIIYGYKRDFQS